MSCTASSAMSAAAATSSTVPAPMSEAALSSALSSWRELQLEALQRKLQRQMPGCAPSSLQQLLAVIEATIQRFYHRSRTKDAEAEEKLPPPHHTPLPSISIPLLSTLRSSRLPFAADIHHLCCPALYHNKLLSSFPSSSHACLPLSPCLLIGKLTSDPSHPQLLMLVDDSGSLRCHVAHVDASMLDQVLLVLHWNLLVTAASRPTRGAVMLEVDASDAVLLSSACSCSSLPPPLAVAPSSLRPVPLHGLTQRRMRKLSSASSSSATASAASAGPSLLLPAPDDQKPPPPQRSSASRAVLYHVRGVVVAKSPIVQRKDGTFFFLQLAASSSDAAAASSSCKESTCFVLFHSTASMCWYHSLHVDNDYLIANLRVKALQLTGGKVRLVFATVAVTAPVSSSASAQPSIPQQTRVFSAKAFVLPQHYSSTSSSPQPRGGSLAGPLSSERPPNSSLSTSPPSPSRRAKPGSTGCPSTRTVSYVGSITRQVELCVYELDNGRIDNITTAVSSLPCAAASLVPCLRLYLTHYDCAALADGIGLRPGCVVRLEHVHPVYHSSRFLGFGCCARSDVSIVSFSPLATICRPFHREGSGALLWSCYQRLSLPDTALLLDTMETLLKKWGRGVKPLLLGNGGSDDARPGLLRQLLNRRLCWQYRGDIYQQVMEHDGCGIAKPHSATQAYPFFPSLSLLFQLPAVSAAFELLCRRLHSDGQSSTAWHCQTVESQQLLLPGMIVTGFLSPSLCSFERKTHSIPPPSSLPIELPARSSASPPAPPVTSVYTGLQLTDSASAGSFSLDCHVTGDWSHEQLDVCYQLQRFQLVLETVPSVGSAAPIIASGSSLPSTPSPHVVAYLCFSLADAVPLIPRVPPTVSATATAQPRVAAGHQAVRLYITHRHTRVLPFAAASKQQRAVAALPSCSPSSLHSFTQQSALPSSLHRGLSCQLHGLLVEDEAVKPSTVRVELQGLLLPLAAVLRVGSVVSLSSCRPVAPALLETAADCELEVDSSAAAEDWKRAMRAHLPVLQSIAELLSCDVNAYYAEGQRDPQLYSFSGIVLEKQFRCDPGAEEASHHHNALRRSSSAPVLQPAAASHSLPPFSSLAMTGRWWLRVRDTVLPHVVDVYLPISQRVFPAAIVPGAAVVVRGAVRKLSPSWKLFMECSHTADIALLPAAPRAEAAAVSSPQLLPFSLLSSFSLIPLTICQLVRRVRCRVLLVKKLTFSLSCLLCSRIVSSRAQARPGWSAGYQCGPGGCKRVELKASAQCIVDDGTGTAFVLAEGDVVWRLLNLRRRDSDELRRFIADVGQLQYEHSYAQLQPAKRRRRDDGMEAMSPSSDDEDEAKGKDGVDYAAFTRQKLCSLFRTAPRGRAVTLHVQQLLLSKEIEAYRAKRSRDEEMRRRQGEGRAGAGSVAEQEMDLLLSCSIGYAVVVSGAAHASKRPAGYLTLRALHCEEMDCLQEVRSMLDDS